MDEISNRINRRLVQINVSIDDLKPATIERLKKIEEHLIEVENSFEEALQVLKLKDCGPTAVSKKLDMSRTTLYNHDQLFKRYIEAAESELNARNPIYHLDLKNAIIDDMRAEVSGLYDRDITLNDLQYKIKDLSLNLNEKEKEISRLTLRNRELASDLNTLQKQTAQPGKVTSISKDNKR